MSSFNEYAPWADVQYTNLTPEEIKAAADAVRGSGGGATSSATAAADPKPVRNQREKYIAAASVSDLATMLKQGVVTIDELQRLLPESKVAQVLDNPVTPAEMSKKFSIPKPDIDSSENPALALQGKSSITGEASSAPKVPAATTSSRPSVSPGGGSGGSGGAASSSVAAAPPPPTPNSPADLAKRGAIGIQGRALLNGQQYNRGASAVQGSDGLWYAVGADGQPSGVGFKTQAAANAATPMTPGGPGLVSRLGNSPTAKAAGQGGFSQTVKNPLFDLIPLDQSIAAGATKGTQVGDILGTISNNGPNFYDITQGGISEGGGLTPVGNSMNPYDSFTGQMPNGDSIGMSSILGNSGFNLQHELHMMSGIPESEIAKLNINTPEKALQFQQAVEDLRAMGMMPNFASLYALNEPAAPGGAYGGSDLKWGSANGGSSNTPYDQALAAFKSYALGSPDLTYLPDFTPSGMGSTQIGNTAYANSGVDEYGTPLEFGDGGQFWTDEPIMGVGVKSQRPKFLMGEAGPEKVTIDPVQDVMMGRERSMSGASTMPFGQRSMGGGPAPTQPFGTRQPGRGLGGGWTRRRDVNPGIMQLMQSFQQRYPQISGQVMDAYNQWQHGGGPRNFAAGGEIYAGGNKGFISASNPIYEPDGTVTEYGTKLGYKSDPTIYTGGATGTMTTDNFLSPNQSKTGQPVPASFELMSAQQKEQFTNQGGALPNQVISGPIIPTSEMYLMGDQYLPVYTQANPKDYSALGEPIGYKYVPYNVGSTPGVVKVPQYNTPMPDWNVINANDKQALINAIQSTDPNYNPSHGVGIGDQKVAQVVLSGNKQAMLAALYDIDPKAAMLLSVQVAQQGSSGNGSGQGMGGGWRKSSQDIQNQASRERYYGVDARNRGRAGLDPATILDIPRETWSGEGEPPWGNGPAPYQNFNGTVPEGFVLPFDYEPGSPWFNRSNQPMPGRGGWGRRGGGGSQGQRPPMGGSGPYQGENPRGGPFLPPQGQTPGQDWWQQLPWWMQQQGGRWGRRPRQGQPLGMGLVPAGAVA